MNKKSIRVLLGLGLAATMTAIGPVLASASTTEEKVTLVDYKSKKRGFTSAYQLEDTAKTTVKTTATKKGTLLSRGIEVSRLMLLAIPLNGSSPSTDCTPLASPPSSEIFEYFTQVFGQLPDRITLLADHTPAALTYYYLLRKAGPEVGALQPRLSDLMLVAINAAECKRDYVRIHADGALKKGTAC